MVIVKGYISFLYLFIRRHLPSLPKFMVQFTEIGEKGKGVFLSLNNKMREVMMFVK